MNVIKMETSFIVPHFSSIFKFSSYTLPHGFLVYKWQYYTRDEDLTCTSLHVYKHQGEVVCHRAGRMRAGELYTQFS